MRTYPWEPPDEPERRQPPDSATPQSEPNEGAQAATGADALTHLPAQLRNWQVVEIDGEATVLDAVEGAGSAAQPAAILERVDDVVVVVLAQRRIAVAPGETATFKLDLINNGAEPARFEVLVEGWIDESWCRDLPLRVPLQPGERAPVSISLTPPADTASVAGDYPLAIVARAAAYPGRVSRLAATLTLAPVHALAVGVPQPKRLTTSWFQRSATLILPITNHGNAPASYVLHAADRQGQCDFTILTDTFQTDSTTSGEAAVVAVAAGRTVRVPVEVRPAFQPLVRLTPRVLPFRIVVTAREDAALRRSVDAQVACAPMVGPWHMAALGLAALVVLVGSGLAGLVLLLALRSTSQPVALPAPAPAEAPVFAFVLNMQEPVPTRMPAPTWAEPAVPVVQPGDVTAPDAPVGNAGAEAPQVAPVLVDGAPVVQAGQVTAPGEPLPPAAQTPIGPVAVAPQAVAPQAAAPQAAAPPAAPRANMTYAQMFREIGLRYDLNWRMLAATAYVESGFDSLALGNRGDLGLMQIQPGTWREWAAQVGAADPFDSYSNVLVGAAYLDYLRTLLSQRGYPGQEWMLVAYNWGPDKALDYLAGGGTWETLDPELRNYALDVLRIAETIPAN